MKVKEVGEFGLIDKLKTGTIHQPGTVVVGIGDDAAVFLPTPHRLQLITTDMLVEHIHFDLKTTLPLQLGYKAMAVNFSDIAAMGGTPCHAVVSVAITEETDVEFVVNLYQGMKEICREYGVNIVGGDTVSSQNDVVINVAVTGEVDPSLLVRRSGANSGDIVAVTGTLGSSSMGLELLKRGDWEDYPFAWPLVTAHLTPKPLVAVGEVLARFGATSMNDISDGLASEANEIAVASHVGMVLDESKIPLSEEVKEAAQELGLSPVHQALYGGEDFQLVFTISEADFAALSTKEVGVPITAIGQVVVGRDVLLQRQDGTTTILKPQGYNHFR